MQRPVTARWFVAAVVACLLTGCATSSSSGEHDETSAIRGADYSDTGPGSLIEANEITNIDQAIPLGTTSARVVYRSTSGVDGSETEVSGAVFIPPGLPPRGGWPVIAFAHGTTGFSSECGPSLSPDLRGSAGGVAKFVREGFAVAAADYQGLGMPGPHPYLDAKTAGLNVIDSVRAVRAVSRDVSATWAAYGGSQGGAATWAANEQAAAYAPELNLVGTVSLVPTADLSDLATAAADQALNKDQTAMYIGILHGLERTRPDFYVDNYRRGLVKDKWDVLAACSGEPAEERTSLLERVASADLVPKTRSAQEHLHDLLVAMALPQLPASAPMLVIYTGADEYIFPESTRRAVERACALGGQVEVIFQPQHTHGDVDGSESFEWIRQRFQGRPAPSNC